MDIQSHEKEYKKILEESKSCDKIILQNMDSQLNKFKDFQKNFQDRKQNITSLFADISQLVQNQSPVPVDIFNQLQSAFQTHEKEYEVLLSDIFGEGGAFAQKIILSDQLDNQTTLLDECRSNISKLREELNKITEIEREHYQKTSEAELLFKNSEKEYSKLEKNLSQIAQQITDSQVNFDLEKSKLHTTTDKVEKIEKIVSEYDQELTNIRNNSYQHQEDLSDARVNYNNAETQARGLLADIKSLEDRVADYERQMKTVEHDKNQCQKTINDLQEEIDDLLEAQDELVPQLEKTKKEMEQHSNDMADLRQAKKVLDQMHKDNIEKFTKLRMREGEIEGSLSERRASFEAMRKSFYEQFKIEGEIALEKNESLDYLNEQIRIYRDRLNQMGNVNLLAIEQFQTSKEHYSHLLFQKEDVEAAAADTEMLINETNKESAERFVMAFEQIRKSFRALFSELFNGGKADLILKDKSDPLRSGIDIMAEPPGQKFQNVSLLSGGQRAMVAIAVIFSILELKPTPFVILDEMDAPLDDENIDRFKRLLVRFKGTSQFVVVSHSKSTLEVCDVLFGVTMEELGCSKVMSVAFDDTENLVFT